MKKILVIASHPDDEILGCGATMAKHIANGDHVKVLILAEGITSRNDKRDLERAKNELMKLKETTLRANMVLGIRDVSFGDLPDNRMDSVDLIEIVKVIEKIGNEFDPNIVYTHHPGDLNIDHKLTAQATLTAFRPLPGSSVEKVLFFEVLSATHWGDVAFSPNYFVDTTAFADQKLKALECYEGEMRSYPHARSVKAVQAQLKFRGAVVGVRCAEAFQVGRIRN